MVPACGYRFTVAAGGLMKPEDPMTPMAQAGVEMHEMYTSWVAAGFNRKEALYLVGKYVAATVAAQNSTPPDMDD